MNAMQATDWVPLRSKSALVTICFVDGRHAPCRQEIKQLPAVIGRSEFAEVQVKDAWASDIQCAIAYTGGGLVVRDLESRHGTRVNGETIQVRRLHEGDVITVGGMTSIMVLRVAESSDFEEAARNYSRA